MKHPLHAPAVFLMCLALAAAPANARKTGVDRPQPTSTWSDVASRDYPGRTGEALQAAAVATTLTLASYRFETGGTTCSAQGWTTVDLTAQAGDYWHVDDFTGSPWAGTRSWYGAITFNPIQGAKSMWLGVVPPPANPVNTILCQYLSLPGYGNGWNQAFCTKACLNIAGGATADLDVGFKIKFDSEPSYDATSLEYTADCSGNTGWTELEGGNPWWTGGDSLTVAGSYAVGAGPVKVRIHFTSDPIWSNQDGLYTGLGVVLDSLSVETLAVEDFEDEALGANSGNDWASCNTPGHGNYLALFRRAGANYEDECRDNVTCYWAALQGSTEFYSCGVPSQPTQKIVPHVNIRGEYIANEIWSPVIPFTGSGSEFHLRYTVYRDLPLDNLIYHVWHVRTIGASGCPGYWKDRGFYYYGDTKDWAVVDHSIGSKMDFNGAVSMQVAIGVIDMCPQWCGVLGSGACHSPAPYIDRVQVLRVDTVGPQWDVRDVDLFQDTFSADGTTTGTARIDTALDIKPAASPTFAPGDSAVVLYLVDPKYVVGNFTTASGLLPDPVVSTFIGRHKTKRQVYMYVAVQPFGQPGKSGAPLSEGPGGQANRYPFMGTILVNGITWTKIRMDYTYASCTGWFCDELPTDPLIPNRFNVDLNDHLFTPGDTLHYFFRASSADGTTYFTTELGAVSSMSEAASNAMEVTVLPAGGYNRGGNILYVDGADGLGVQSYYDGAFMVLGLANLVDRYDVRGPSSAVSNRPGGRVVDVVAQLNACYDLILWDCGSVPVTLGDGTGDPEKTDDYALLNTFLDNLAHTGGVVLLGDDVAEQLSGYSGASAAAFLSTYMPFSLINGNHRLAPTLLPISPDVEAWPGRAFSDNFFVFGGCPQLNDFDVIGAIGTSRVEMAYNTATSANGAVVSDVNGMARVVMSGFSLAYVRDDELNGISDRAKFLRDVILYASGSNLNPVVGAGPAPANSLSQNYPNPFNPQTTIAFAIKTRGHVEVNVYDVGGRLVRTLANETRAAGPHTVTWDGRDGSGTAVASGVYFYRLVAGEFTQTRKMVLLK